MPQNNFAISDIAIIYRGGTLLFYERFGSPEREFKEADASFLSGYFAAMYNALTKFQVQGFFHWIGNPIKLIVNEEVTCYIISSEYYMIIVFASFRERTVGNDRIMTHKVEQLKEQFHQKYGQVVMEWTKAAIWDLPSPFLYNRKIYESHFKDFSDVVHQIAQDDE